MNILYLYLYKLGIYSTKICFCSIQKTKKYSNLIKSRISGMLLTSILEICTNASVAGGITKPSWAIDTSSLASCTATCRR